MLAVFPLVIVVISAVVYHLAQRSLGGGPTASPWPTLAFAYGAAFVITLVIAWATADGALRMPAKPERSAALMIALGAIGIEAGFFFVYRAGWPLASASVIGNVAVALILAVIGVLAFGEQLSAARGAGILIAATGAYLVVQG
jgi:hypothetical protein